MHNLMPKSATCSQMQFLIHLILVASIGFLIGSSFIPFSNSEEITYLDQILCLDIRSNDIDSALSKLIASTQSLKLKTTAAAFLGYDMGCQQLNRNNLRAKNWRMEYDYSYLNLKYPPQVLFSVNGFTYFPKPSPSHGTNEIIHFTIIEQNQKRVLIQMTTTLSDFVSTNLEEVNWCFLIIGEKREFD